MDYILDTSDSAYEAILQDSLTAALAPMCAGSNGWFADFLEDYIDRHISELAVDYADWQWVMLDMRGMLP